MNVLEEFWYGNLDPAEYDANPSKEYKELVRLISRNEEKLLVTMTEEQKDLFSRYTDCVRIIRPWRNVCCFGIVFAWEQGLCWGL